MKSKWQMVGIGAEKTIKRCGYSPAVFTEFVYYEKILNSGKIIRKKIKL